MHYKLFIVYLKFKCHEAPGFVLASPGGDTAHQHSAPASTQRGWRPPGACARGSAMTPAVNTENRGLVSKVPSGDRTFWKADKVLCQLASSKVGDEDLVGQAQADSRDGRQESREGGDSLGVGSAELKQQVLASTGSGVPAWRPECLPAKKVLVRPLCHELITSPRRQHLLHLLLHIEGRTWGWGTRCATSSLVHPRKKPPRGPTVC